MAIIPTLPADVAKDYNCVKVIPGEVVWRNRTYDLTKIDVKTAEVLVNEKFPYLQKKTASVNTSSVTGGDKKP